jgi:hypothetical protein
MIAYMFENENPLLPEKPLSPLLEKPPYIMYTQ